MNITFHNPHKSWFEVQARGRDRFDTEELLPLKSQLWDAVLWFSHTETHKSFVGSFLHFGASFLPFSIQFLQKDFQVRKCGFVWGKSWVCEDAEAGLALWPALRRLLELRGWAMRGSQRFFLLCWKGSEPWWAAPGSEIQLDLCCELKAPNKKIRLQFNPGGDLTPSVCQVVFFMVLLTLVAGSHKI